MESLTLMLLRRPPNPPELTEAEEERIFEAHLDFLDAGRKEGLIGAAGPFRDQDDESVRGMCVYRVGLDVACRHAAKDPEVQAGQLVAEPMTWWFRDGEVRLFPRPDRDEGMPPTPLPTARHSARTEALRRAPARDGMGLEGTP
jgi:uncharacterized protein YciI